MMRLRFIFLGLIFFVGCSKILSERTDEQAWIEFDQSSPTSRKPASVNDLKSSVALHDELLSIPMRSILFRCDSLATREVCYRAEVMLRFDEAFHRVQLKYPELKLSDYRKEQKEFLESRSYENLISEVSRFHQSLLSGLDLKSREHAEALFHECVNEINAQSSI